MSSLAQEDSRSISENVTWGQRKRFADGKVSMAYKHFLGYRKGRDGKPEIDPEEAETVRCIYRWFMEGQTYCTIASRLTKEDVLSPGGKQKWQPNTVKSILTNEKYMGAAIDLFTDLRNAVAFGIPAEEAIRAATIRPAREIGRAGEIGSIEPGKLADFVICGEGFSVRAVYIGGEKL